MENEHQTSISPELACIQPHPINRIHRLQFRYLNKVSFSSLLEKRLLPLNTTMAITPTTPTFIPSIPVLSSIPSSTSSLNAKAKVNGLFFHTGYHARPQQRRLNNRQICTTCCSSPSSSSPSSSSPSPSTPSELKVGQVVAIQRNKLQKRPDLAVITGGTSSGDTVDVRPLDEFVKELYVESEKGASTFEKASDIYPITAEYAPSQNGWIVLDTDLQPAKSYFEQRFAAPANIVSNAKINVDMTKEEGDKQPLSEEQKKRQFFRPSKGQAFVAAALSLPLSAVFYSAYTTASNVYQANPQGNELLSGSFFRTFILFVSLGSSFLSLVTGSALFLYALSLKEDQEDQS